MVLADRLKQFLLHLEIYLVYEKEHEVGHCHQLCCKPGVVSSILTGGSIDAGVKRTKKIPVDNLYPFFTYKIGCRKT